MNTKIHYRTHHASQNALLRLLALEKKQTGEYLPTMEQLLAERPITAPRGVYVHVPLCDRICSFCNMNRKQADNRNIRAYAEELVEFFRSYGKTPYVSGGGFDVVYFGGGTPTVFSNPDLKRILTAFSENFSLSEGYEWTFETTLHNLTDEKAELLQQAGVNRLSIGAQTFSNMGRRLLNRKGDRSWAIDRLKRLRNRFEGVLGIDLIYNYPGQTFREMDDDLSAVAQLDLDGVSFYSLMIPDNSILGTAISSGEVLFERDLDEEKELHHRLYMGLKELGFSRLELTKMVKPGRDDYRYIRILYGNNDLVPAGKGAGGKIGGYDVYHIQSDRSMISPINHRYAQYNFLLGYLQFGEYELDRLQYLAGSPSPNDIQKIMAEYTEEGYLEKTGKNSWQLTPDGIFWGNNLSIDFLQRIIPQPEFIETGVGI